LRSKAPGRRAPEVLHVTELGTLPEAVGAIGARFSPDGYTM